MPEPFKLPVTLPNDSNTPPEVTPVVVPPAPPKPADTVLTVPPVPPVPPQPNVPDFLVEGGTIVIDNKEYTIRDGNAVLLDGTVFKTKDELIALAAEPPKIKIDDKIYNLDALGNAIDENQNIVLTKAQIDDFAKNANTNTGTTIDQVIEAVGFKPLENGKPISFDNSVEGMTAYIQSYTKELEVAAANNAINSLFNAYPVINRIINHLDAKGTIEGFDFKVDPNVFKVDADNEESITRTILHSLSLKGLDPETAKAVLETKKKDGKAIEFAKEQETFITNYYNKIDADNQRIIEDQRKEAIANHDRYWGVSVDDNGNYSPNSHKDGVYHKIINDGKITVDGETYSLPLKISFNNNGKIQTMDRTEFFEFMFVPEEVSFEDGTKAYYTPFEIFKMQQQAKRTVDHDILEAFKLITGSASQLIASNKTKQFLTTPVTSITTKTQQPSSTPEFILPVKLK